jgi:flavin-dependent dehydrogenase
MTMSLQYPRPDTDYDAIIVGGGLAGLVCAILLSRSQKRVLLIEKKTYPFHRVCGEYISNEVLSFLQALGFDPFFHGAMPISRLRVSTPAGKNYYAPLDLGGFGLSRYTMDHQLYQLALRSGAEILTDTKVVNVNFNEHDFTISTNSGDHFTSRLAIGSYGKRDTLDKQLNRSFMQVQTGYLGVKYHIRTDYPVDEIGLDNFEGGYCGISRVEQDTYNLCYLHHRDQNTQYKMIPDIEAHYLHSNPILKSIFSNSEFLFAKPEAIFDFSFDRKEPVVDHILMCGDTAGLITPLCGNGMSMAIHGAKLLTELILSSGLLASRVITPDQRIQLESAYREQWRLTFSRRLFWGRTIQKLFGNTALTGPVIAVIHAVPPVERWLISQTHGRPLEVA